MNSYRYIIKKEDENTPIKKIIRREFRFSSRMMTKVKYQELSRLNGSFSPGWTLAKAGDLLEVRLPEESSGFEPEDIPVIPLFEDETLLIISKPPGYTVHPTGGRPDHTMANGVMKYMLDRGDSYKIRFINRLDMDTSGILVIGKDAQAQYSFMKQMENRTIIKRYLAIVKGIFEEKEGLIDLPVGKPDRDDVRRKVTPEGAACLTRYKVVEEFRRHSLLRITLETGRTHQIRVHMSHIGHPVLGDNLYDVSDPLIARQALHAWQLAFDHPLTGERLEITAPLPSDMEEAIKKLRDEPQLR